MPFLKKSSKTHHIKIRKILELEEVKNFMQNETKISSILKIYKST